jgi:hypothetical protein
MKQIILIALFGLLATHFTQAQKSTVYAEAGLGWGQTLFFGNMSEQLKASYGGSFSPNIGNNLMMAFYVAPERWKGLGTPEVELEIIAFDCSQFMLIHLPQTHYLIVT